MTHENVALSPQVSCAALSGLLPLDAGFPGLTPWALLLHPFGVFKVVQCLALKGAKRLWHYLFLPFGAVVLSSRIVLRQSRLTGLRSKYSWDLSAVRRPLRCPGDCFENDSPPNLCHSWLIKPATNTHALGGATRMKDW